MNRADRYQAFRDWLDKNRMTQDDFAFLTDQRRETVCRWGRPGHTGVPRWVILLIDAWDLLGGPVLGHVIPLDEQEVAPQPPREPTRADLPDRYTTRQKKTR